MNQQLALNNCILLKNFISPERAKSLAQELLFFRSKGFLEQDPRAGLGLYGKAYKDGAPFLEILCESVNKISDWVGEKVLPTYTYAIVYEHDSKLIPHVDREACEIGVTLHLDGDTPWPIYVETPEKQALGFDLEPGDAVLYLGCVANHWRESYKGQEYCQAFFHYVRSRGPNSWAYFDKQK
jgi:hypothetical protein